MFVSLLPRAKEEAAARTRAYHFKQAHLLPMPGPLYTRVTYHNNNVHDILPW